MHHGAILHLTPLFSTLPGALGVVFAPGGAKKLAPGIYAEAKKTQNTDMNVILAFFNVVASSQIYPHIFWDRKGSTFF